MPIGEVNSKMNKRRRRRKLIGILVIIFTIIFWCYAAAWASYIHPFLELVEITIANGLEYDVLRASERIVIKFSLVTILTVIFFYCGIRLIKRK